jgi:hypothetical protein
LTNRAKVAHARAPHCSPIQSLLLALVSSIVTSLLLKLRIVIARFSLLAGRLGIHRAGRYRAEAGAPRRAMPRLEAVRRRHSQVRTRNWQELRCTRPPAARRRGSQRQSGAIAVPTTAAIGAVGAAATAAEGRRPRLALLALAVALSLSCRGARASVPEAQPRHCTPERVNLEAAVPARLGSHGGGVNTPCAVWEPQRLASTAHTPRRAERTGRDGATGRDGTGDRGSDPTRRSSML